MQLALNSFNPVRDASPNQRFILDQSKNGVQVATEGLGGRILSFLGTLPLFNKIDAVKAHVEQVKTQNKEVLETFVKALAQGSPRLENQIKDCLDTSGAKSLTSRVFQQLSQCIKDKGGELKALFKEAAADLGNAASLKTLIGKNLVTERSSGALNDVISGLKTLAQSTEHPGIQDFASTLLNVKVGGHSFSNWSSGDWGVDTLLRSSKLAKNEQMADLIKSIAAEADNLKKAVLEFAEDKMTTLGRPSFGLTAFKNVLVAPETQVMLDDGRPMPVNTLHVGGNPVALAGSYPKKGATALSAHLRMLVEQKCSTLVVLAGNDQVSDKGLPPYFKQGGHYGDVTVVSEFKGREDFAGSLRGSEPRDENTQIIPAKDGDFSLPQKALDRALVVEKYNLKITIDGNTVNLPVLHATNWPDHGILKDSTQLESLANMVQKEIDTSGNPDGLPMIHCKGGVGRTGTLTTALQLLKDPSADVGGIIKDLKASRNELMCEDAGQRQQLKLMSDRLKENKVASYDELYVNSDGGYGSVDDLYANRDELENGYVNAADLKSYR